MSSTSKRISLSTEGEHIGKAARLITRRVVSSERDHRDLWEELQKKPSHKCNMQNVLLIRDDQDVLFNTLHNIVHILLKG